ncbi:MAG: DUF1326 domain-containing protein [Tepidisphaeraceae bacterium]
MSRRVYLLALIAVLGVIGRATDARQSAAPNWSMNATIIEACSCPMFCQCYFNSSPAASGEHAGHGGGEHFCRFNNAFRVNSGHVGDITLDGCKFWVSGDLGGDFSKGQMDWAVLTFDPSVAKPQREAIQKIVAHIYPVKWNSFSVADDASIDWKYDNDRAEARMDGGKRAEVVLKRFPGNTSEPIVIKNLKYWGTPRNDGFVLMPNEVQAFRVVPQGQKPFEFKGTNGFMITFDINSNDVKQGG